MRLSSKVYDILEYFQLFNKHLFLSFSLISHSNETATVIFKELAFDWHVHLVEWIFHHVISVVLIDCLEGFRDIDCVGLSGENNLHSCEKSIRNRKTRQTLILPVAGWRQWSLNDSASMHSMPWRGFLLPTGEICSVIRDSPTKVEAILSESFRLSLGVLG